MIVQTFKGKKLFTFHNNLRKNVGIELHQTFIKHNKQTFPQNFTKINRLKISRKRPIEGRSKILVFKNILHFENIKHITLDLPEMGNILIKIVKYLNSFSLTKRTILIKGSIFEKDSLAVIKRTSKNNIFLYFDIDYIESTNNETYYFITHNLWSMIFYRKFCQNQSLFFSFPAYLKSDDNTESIWGRLDYIRKKMEKSNKKS